MDHSALLLQYLDTPSHPVAAPVVAAAAESHARQPRESEALPEWTDVQTQISTALGAPAFHQLRRAQHTLDIDVEVEQFIDGALEEHDAFEEPNIEIEWPEEEPEGRESLEIDLLFLEPTMHPPVEITIDIDLVTEKECIKLEASIARESDTLIWEGLDGELGVFLATYQTLPIGTQVQVLVHVMGESFVAPATVRWLRQEHTGVWPGLGLEFDVVTQANGVLLERFAAIRPNTFHSS